VNAVTQKELDEQRKELFERKIGAEGEFQQAQSVFGVVKERHDELTTQMFGAVTPEDRYRYKAQVDEHAEKLKNASLQFENRKTDLTAATDALDRFDAERSKDADRMGIAAASAVKDLHDLAEGVLPPDAIQAKQQAVSWVTDVTWPYVRDVGLGVAIQGELQNVADSVKGVADSLESQKLADAQKLEVDKAFHSEQLAAVGQIKSEIVSQIDASKAEMQKVMGSDWSLAGQKEFAQNEFNYAFQKTNDFIAGQTQERDNFFAGNLSVLSPIEQQQNRTAMNEELHAAHYGLTRDLAVKQAEINVDLGNKEMMNQLEKKEVGQGVQKDDLQSAIEPLRRIQEEQRPNDIYMEANKIHTQNCPELSQNPPMAPQQQGPEGPGM
jgi:hypothetical protein